MRELFRVFMVVLVGRHVIFWFGPLWQWWWWWWLWWRSLVRLSVQCGMGEPLPCWFHEPVRSRARKLFAGWPAHGYRVVVIPVCSMHRTAFCTL